VKNPTVNHAVYSAYGDTIPKDRHPGYFLFLEIDPRRIDVNVHPAKKEIRFERPDDIYHFVKSAVYSTLNPEHEIKPSPVSTSQTIEFHHKTPETMPKLQMTPLTGKPNSTLNHSQTDFFTSGITDDVSPFFYIGESFFAKVSPDGLVIIDQHAAHERILYEKFLKKTSIETETLFLPLRIELPVKEYNLIIKHKNTLQSLGLDIEDFGANNIIIRALPKELSKADMKGLLLDIAAGILEEETSGIKSELTEEALLKNIAARLACHRSVRGKEQLNNEEMSKMMADLDKADEPDKCPHGRPTRVFLSLDDLNKMFKRK
jgi:DNA mismatch repair protein MutL